MARIDYAQVDPKAVEAMNKLEAYVLRSGLERSLLHLIKMRVSQINHCGYCLDMHSKDARAAGETEQRLYVLPDWRDAPFYTERERAGLLWTETLTNIAETHASDEVYDEVRKQFSEAEMIPLTMAIVTINSWNRLAIGFRADVGTYEAPQRSAHPG
jgi:AhpD family alkylhydroperoxidase